MAKKRNVIYINGGDITTRGTKLQQVLHGIHNNLMSNKTINSFNQIDCSKYWEPLMGLLTVSKNLKEIIELQEKIDMLPPLIVIDAHGIVKDGVHHTQLSKEKTVPTALLYSTLRESFGEEKIDVIQTPVLLWI